MCTWVNRLALLGLLAALAGCGADTAPVAEAEAAQTGNDDKPDMAATEPSPSPWQGKYGDVGRAATAAEIDAWDIDVRPDFKGLPPGSGSVEEGEEVWLAQCSSCHGDFGDSNEVFTPLVLGNVTEEDIETGRVEALNDPARVRTTFMKVSTVSTLWDYIHRAMPWNNPKSLSDDQVYAVLAYLLNLAYIVDYEFTLSHENIDDIQAKMPNRNGMTRDHGLWKIDGEPDTANVACMTDCDDEVEILSSIPDYAKGANGNLAQQMRPYTATPGIDTAEEAEEADVEPASAGNEQTATGDTAPAPADDGMTADTARALAGEYGCTGCHQMDGKLVGPGFAAISDKYADRDDAAAYLADKIRNGGKGVWGQIPMPPQSDIPDEDIAALAEWLASGDSN